MLAFSTCWNTGRHDDGEDIITEICELGFDTIELSHGMTIPKLPGIQRAFKNGMFKCCGVHNFFPSPTEVTMDAPDAYEYTSFREHERERAFKLTLKTFEVAADFNAKYVVLHMGSNHKMPSRKWSKLLEGMVKEGQYLSPAYTKHKAKFIKQREKTGELYMRRAMHYLEELAEKAKEYNLKLAIESRSHFEQVPTEAEMVQFQEYFKDNDTIGYWHDFGHVHRKHNLGLLNHEEWLAKMNPYLIGGHLHDVQWPIRDHRVPFQGNIPYAPLMENFTSDLPLVWELSPGRKTEDIKSALVEWKERFPDTL